MTRYTEACSILHRIDLFGRTFGVIERTLDRAPDGAVEGLSTLHLRHANFDLTFEQWNGRWRIDVDGTIATTRGDWDDATECAADLVKRLDRGTL